MVNRYLELMISRLNCNVEAALAYYQGNIGDQSYIWSAKGYPLLLHFQRRYSKPV